MEDKKLFIGLDVGSDSVGWAATDENFNLYRLKGKTAWGARLFDEASSAKDRRLKRGNRRRLQRRRYRIELLNKLFAEEIGKIDPNFFNRLEESNLWLEDKKKAKCPYLLFGDKNKEKEFYKKFPTIWHLRDALINKDGYALSDIRYVYLAMHHIFKYRGNFISDNKFSDKFNYNVFSELNSIFENILRDIEEDEDVSYSFIDNNNYDDILSVLSNENFNKKDKKRELKKYIINNQL